MAKGDQIALLNKKAENIKLTRDNESVVKEINISTLLERPMELISKFLPENVRKTSYAKMMQDREAELKNMNK